MCGMVGVRDAFYSKTKRFCSVSCSRSFSSNSKKASILARLQVSPTQSDQNLPEPRKVLICFLSVLKGKPPTKKAKVLQKQPLMTKLAAYAQHQSSQQGGARKSGGYQQNLPHSSSSQTWWLFNSGGASCSLCGRV